jgi:predicted MPP superfamily phosphohydrolase
VIFLLLNAATSLVVLVAVHWYLWRRLVKDVSRKHEWWRRGGTVLVAALSGTTVGTLLAGPAGLPFRMVQVLAWPGYFWLALLIYLTLALLVGELARPLLLRIQARRPGGPPHSGSRTGGTPLALEVTQRGTPVPEAVRVREGEFAASAGASSPGTSPGAGGGRGRGGDPVPDTEPGSGGAAPGGGEGAQGATAPDSTSRRLFVARTVAIGAATLATGTVTAGTIGVLNGPTTQHVTVTLPKLPRRAHGYRIAVVSDVHLGPILGRSHTRRIVEAINATQPDLVAIVGDLVDGTVEDLGPAAEPLTQLRSRHGSFFVTGNHEYFGDARSWIEHLRDLGIHPLENERRELPGFDLAGVNDIAGERIDEGPDFRAALGDRDPARASVLLAHQPVQIHDAVEYDVGLQLSGHTHGGQLWPGPYLAELANPTVAGLERYGDTQLYVTRGAGAWGPPVRVGAESDITVVTLASPQA